jgi:hypothetical protein
MKCGSTIINVVTGERYWDRRTETRPIVFPAKKWSSLQFFHFVGVSDGTDFVRIRHIFYSVQQVKLTTVWELRKYWQTLNVQKISSTGSKLYQQNSSGRTGYFFQSAEDGEVAQRDDIWFQNCTLFSVLAPRREIGMEACSPSGKVCWICGKAVALEDCKVDEHGLPVHDNCYVAKVARRRDMQPQVDEILRFTSDESERG